MEVERAFLIIGVPRSGTTLLRDLLAGNPQIALPPEESQFLPDLFAVEERAGPGPHFVQAAAEVVSRSNYAYLMRRRHGTPPSVLVDSVQGAADAIDALRKVVLASQESPLAAVKAWGDKTPNYLFMVERILSARPFMKFIYIIRDPRDVALSMNRAWGKSAIRSALEWRDTETELARLKEVEALNSGNLFELSYEQLLRAPVQTLKALSQFLDVEFEPAMVELQTSSERWGAAAGHTGLKADNLRKFAVEQDAEETRVIEAVCADQMIERGYGVSEDPAPRARVLPGPLALRTAALLDSVRVMSRYIREFGVIRGLRYKLRQGGVRRWKAEARRDRRRRDES